MKAKSLACALPLLTVLPGVASAQLRLSVRGSAEPVVRAAVGPVVLSAGLGRRGVAVRVVPSGARRPAGRLPTRVRTGGVPAGRASASAARVLATAGRYVGTRYTYGGETPAGGFDCSGFVQYVFGRHGIALPRTSREQAGAGRAVPAGLASLRPGDLMLFASGGARVDHVAIYVGGGRIVHASSGAGKVLYDDLTGSRGGWYLARHVASRRVLP